MDVRATRRALLGGCAGALLGGCALRPPVAYPTPPEFGTSYETGVPTRPGSLRLAVGAIGPTLNPASVRSDPMATEVWDWYNPVLFSIADSGQRIELDPDYLISIDRTDDGAVRYRLNPRARFNDGTPLAEGFTAMWKLASQPGFVSDDGYRHILAVDADGTNVTVRFATGREPVKLFQRVVHPAATLTSATTANPQASLGAGPYAIARMDDRAATFVPNPAWWGERPLLKDVTLRALSSSEALVAWKAGGLDAVDATNRTSAREIDAELICKGTRIDRMVLQLNRRGLLADARLREGVLRAIDPRELATLAFAGLGYSEQVPGTLFSYEYQGKLYWHAAVMADVLGETGAKVAGDVFETAGWRERTDGVRQRDGRTLALQVLVCDEGPLASGLVTVLVQQLRNAGVGAVGATRPRRELMAALESSAWDVVIRPLAGVDDPLWRARAWYGSDGRLSASAGMDERLARVGLSTETAEPASAERAVFEQFTVLPLWNGPQWRAVRPGLVNVGATGYATPRKSRIGWAS